MIAELLQDSYAYTPLPINTVAQFYAGFQWVSTQNDKHEEILSCYDNSATINNMFGWLMGNWHQVNDMSNAKIVWNEYSEWVERDLRPCKGVDTIYADYTAIAEHINEVFARADADEHVAKKWLHNKARILELNEQMNTLWNQGWYDDDAFFFAAGNQLGYIAQCLGLVKGKCPTSELEDEDFGATVPYLFQLF